MKSIVKAIWSSGYDNLASLHPSPLVKEGLSTNPYDFSVLIAVEVGPEDGLADENHGADTFYARVCSPNRAHERHHFVFDHWDWPRIEAEIRRQFTVEGRDWEDIAKKLNEHGDWEFDNYRESIP